MDECPCSSKHKNPYVLVLLILAIVTLVLCVPLLVFTITSSVPTSVDESKTFTNSTGMVMVSLSTGYYVSKYEVTQNQFELIMGYNPSTFRSSSQPVESITATEAEEFCKRLTEREKGTDNLPSGFTYVLPSFAEWPEYLADAPLEGSVTPAGMANRKLASPMPVGTGETNHLGIYDLRGNVTEFSRDREQSTGTHVILGASWNTHRKDYLRPRNRAYFMKNSDKSCDVGFRCVLISN